MSRTLTSSDEALLLANIRGELRFLFDTQDETKTPQTPHQWRDSISKIIDLLSREISLMRPPHPSLLFKLEHLCSNINSMEGIDVLNHHGNPQRIYSSIQITDVSNLLQYFEKLREILIYFEKKHGGVPHFKPNRTKTIRDYFESLKHYYHSEYFDLWLVIMEINSEIYVRSDTQDVAVTAFERYIKNLNTIKENLQLPEEQITERFITSVNGLVLDPGCEMFNVDRGDPTSTTPTEILTVLTELITKADEHLRNEKFVIEWGNEREKMRERLKTLATKSGMIIYYLL